MCMQFSGESRNYPKGGGAHFLWTYNYIGLPIFFVENNFQPTEGKALHPYPGSPPLVCNNFFNSQLNKTLNLTSVLIISLYRYNSIPGLSAVTESIIFTGVGLQFSFGSLSRIYVIIYNKDSPIRQICGTDLSVKLIIFQTV